MSNSPLQSATSQMLIKSALNSDAYQTVSRLSRNQKTRKRLVRAGLIAFNGLLLVGVLLFVIMGQHGSQTASHSLVSATANAASASSVANPLDQVSSADIAYNVATLSAMSETRAVANQAASVNLELAVAPSTASIVSKPIVPNTGLKSKRDIKSYNAVAGDTVASIAAKFNVTSDSIKWSNNLTTNAVTIGQNLSVPPEGMSGVVYIVKAGDTPDTLAVKYKANREEIIAANDVDYKPLQAGDKIIIPGGSVAAPIVVAARSSSAGLAFGTTPIYGSNAYIYGYCTWYVANRIAVPSNWGNANTWDNGAAISGWTVSSVPRVGAIAQTDRGAEGHVAVVEAVSADGTMIKYADMNGLAGWNREGRTPDFVSASKFEHYIYQ